MESRFFQRLARAAVWLCGQPGIEDIQTVTGLTHEGLIPTSIASPRQAPAPSFRAWVTSEANHLHKGQDDMEGQAPGASGQESETAGLRAAPAGVKDQSTIAAVTTPCTQHRLLCPVFLGIYHDDATVDAVPCSEPAGAVTANLVDPTPQQVTTCTPAFIRPAQEGSSAASTVTAPEDAAQPAVLVEVSPKSHVTIARRKEESIPPTASVEATLLQDTQHNVDGSVAPLSHEGRGSKSASQSTRSSSTAPLPSHTKRSEGQSSRIPTTHVSKPASRSHATSSGSTANRSDLEALNLIVRCINQHREAVGALYERFGTKPEQQYTHLGGGGFGNAFSLTAASKTAFKYIPAENLENGCTEAGYLLAARHPHILPGISLTIGFGEDVFAASDSFLQPGDASSGPCLVFQMEAGAHSLKEAIRGCDMHCGPDGKLQPVEALTKMRGIADALRYLHDHGVVHDDVKTGNVVVCATAGAADSTYKLIDFGCAHVHDPQVKSYYDVEQGEVVYMAPEAYDQSRGTSPASDVFGLGVAMVELLTGKSGVYRYNKAFRKGNTFLGVKGVVKGAGRQACLGDLLAHLPQQLQYLLWSMTANQPGRRPSAAQVVEWLDAIVVELLEQLQPLQLELQQPQAVTPLFVKLSKLVPAPDSSSLSPGSWRLRTAVDPAGVSDEDTPRFCLGAHSPTDKFDSRSPDAAADGAAAAAPRQHEACNGDGMSGQSRSQAFSEGGSADEGGLPSEASTSSGSWDVEQEAPGEGRIAGDDLVASWYEHSTLPLSSSTTTRANQLQQDAVEDADQDGGWDNGPDDGDDDVGYGARDASRPGSALGSRRGSALGSRPGSVLGHVSDARRSMYAGTCSGLNPNPEQHAAKHITGTSVAASAAGNDSSSGGSHSGGGSGAAPTPYSPFAELMDAHCHALNRSGNSLAAARLQSVVGGAGQRYC